MFIIDIFIYIVIAWLLYGYTSKAYYNASSEDEEDEKTDRNIWIFWILFAVICGIRWNVGVDSRAYMRFFAFGIVKPDSVEYLWDALVLAVYGLHLHYVIGMAITGFVQIYFATKIASKYRYILVFLPIVLFGGDHFLGWCNAVRQMMAACIFVYSTQYILKKKLVPYLLCIFAASQIHHSSQMLYVMYIFAYIRPDRISFSDKKVMCMSIFITCFVLGMTPQFQSLIGFFSFLVDSLEKYDYVGNILTDTIVKGNINERSFGPMQLSYFLTALAPIWYGRELKVAYKDCLPYFDLWWFFSFIYACGYFLVCNVHFMFIRPFLFFQPFQLLMVSLLLFHLYTTGKKGMFQMLVAVIWMNICWDVIKNSGIPMEAVSYKFFFFHNL